jgi:ABC-type multidrug transport system permease subunit
MVGMKKKSKISKRSTRKSKISILNIFVLTLIICFFSLLSYLCGLERNVMKLDAQTQGLFCEEIKNISMPLP